MRDWSREPHIRLGDPCYDCGRPMTPASRTWSRYTVPPGYRKHAGHGLCSPCLHRRRDTGTLDLDLIAEAGRGTIADPERTPAS